jgi:hypothetical protein
MTRAKNGNRAGGASRARLLGAVGVITALGLAGCTPKPDDTKLTIPIDHLCTTCNDFIRCEASAPTTPGTYTLYHLEPKSFGAQMATIWDYLVQFVYQRKDDDRPLTVYADGVAGKPTAVARTDLIQHRINVPGAWIDQVNGAWHGAGDAVQGQCRLLPMADGWKLVRPGRPAAK